MYIAYTAHRHIAIHGESQGCPVLPCTVPCHPELHIVVCPQIVTHYLSWMAYSYCDIPGPSTDGHTHTTYPLVRVSLVTVTSLVHPRMVIHTLHIHTFWTPTIQICSQALLSRSCNRLLTLRSIAVTTGKLRNSMWFTGSCCKGTEIHVCCTLLGDTITKSTRKHYISIPQLVMIYFHM